MRELTERTETDMGQTRICRGVATRIYDDESGTHVQYHATVVVSFTESAVTLNSGGWRTVTTKLRMNQASNQFNLGFQVYSKRRAWFVSYWNGSEWTVLPFEDGLEIPRHRLRWTGDAWVACDA